MRTTTTTKGAPVTGPTVRKTKDASVANWIMILFGTWLFISPWVLSTALSVGEAATANWNFWIVGAIVVLSAALALRDLHPWEEWTNMILGVWLFLSPWVLGFSQSSNYLWNALIVGAAFVISSAVALPIAHRRSSYTSAARVR